MPIHEKSPYAAGTRQYVRSGAGSGQPSTPDIHTRAEGFIRVLAGHCKGCLRSRSADCERRCPSGGAAALVRDYDLSRIPPMPTTTRPPKQPKPQPQPAQQEG